MVYHADTLSNPKKLFEQIAGLGEGYVIFARKSATGTGWQHIGALPVKDVGRVYELLPPTELTDVYFTLNTFYRVGPMQPNGFHRVYNKGTCRRTGAALPGQRQEVNLQDLRFLYVDMDFYHSCRLAGWDAAADALERAIAKATLPQASLVADSGRGLYALWMLYPHSSHARDVDLYKLLNRALAGHIADHAPELCPDGIHDAARVLRLPGSTNGKSGTTVKYTLGDRPPYKMELLAERLGLRPGSSSTVVLPVLQVVRPDETLPKKTVSPRLRYQRQCAGKQGQLALGARRLTDLESVIAAHPVKHGFRYKTLLILAATARAAGWSKPATVDLLNQHARKCLPAYPCEANDTPPEDLVELAFTASEVPRHTAIGLAKFFGLSTAECRTMGLGTIYTEEIAAEKKKGSRALDREALAAAIKGLLKADSTLATIQAGLKAGHGIKLSCSQISRYVCKLGVSLKRGRPGKKKPSK